HDLVDVLVREQVLGSAAGDAGEGVAVEVVDLDEAAPGEGVGEQREEVELARRERTASLELVESGRRRRAVQAAERAQEDAEALVLGGHLLDVLSCAEAELDEQVLKPCQVGGGELPVSAKLLHGELVLVAAQVGAHLRLEPFPVGAEV